MSIDERGLAAAGAANHHHKWVLADLAHQLPDCALRIVSTAAAEEKRRVLLPEGVETAVGADGVPDRCPRRSPAVNRRQQMLQLERCVVQLIR
jgi:hypothetical protein